MRKLKLQVQITIDGFIAGPNGEMDWLTFNWDDALKSYVSALTEPVDCIILGRKLAQGFIPHWVANPQLEGALKINETQKVVFTKTIDESNWANTILAKGDLNVEINKLKEQDGQDIIVYGGGSFVSALLKQGLIDELHLFINPVAIGDGMPIFKELGSTQIFNLLQATPFSCGIVVLQYERNCN
jgi:dihydrofolate reductase